MKQSRGFTLLELMIVLAIIALLAAVAIPTYRRYAIRAHRPDGQELLLRIASAQERFYATNNHYAALTELNYADPAPSEKGYYNVTVVPAAASTSAQTFTATATPTAKQADDDCGSLTINNAGVKGSSGTTTNGSCW